MRKPSLRRRHPAMKTGTVLYLVCLVAGCRASQQCSVPRTSSMGITVLSRRNETGHWTAQLNFTHDSDMEGRRSSGPWLVDFNQTTSVCQTGEAVLIVATLTSVPVAAEATNSSSTVLRVDESQYHVVDGVGSYKLHTNPKTWEDARKKCTSEGGHLAIINSLAEVKAILDIWQLNTRLKNYFVFLGFNDINGEGNYVTVKGERMEDTGYNEWEKGQPDDSRRENCGGINRSGKLHDLSCTTKIPFFCEKEAPTL